jgi:hypothetical protein
VRKARKIEEGILIKRSASDVKAARARFLSNPAAERVELLWIVSTYLVGKNESENQKGNLSYLAGTKKRSDSLMQ